MSTFDVKLGLMLKELRESKQLSQKQLADKLNRHKSTVSLWESGERQISIGNLWEFTEALGLSDEEKELFYKKVTKTYNPKMLKVFGWDK